MLVLLVLSIINHLFQVGLHVNLFTTGLKMQQQSWTVKSFRSVRTEHNYYSLSCSILYFENDHGNICLKKWTPKWMCLNGNTRVYPPYKIGQCLCI